MLGGRWRRLYRMSGGKCYVFGCWEQIFGIDPFSLALRREFFHVLVLGENIDLELKSLNFYFEIWLRYTSPCP